VATKLEPDQSAASSELVKNRHAEPSTGAGGCRRLDRCCGHRIPRRSNEPGYLRGVAGLALPTLGDRRICRWHFCRSRCVRADLTGLGQDVAPRKIGALSESGAFAWNTSLVLTLGDKIPPTWTAPVTNISTPGPPTRTTYDLLFPLVVIAVGLWRYLAQSLWPRLLFAIVTLLGFMFELVGGSSQPVLEFMAAGLERLGLSGFGVLRRNRRPA
jgi:hypothetical protein